MKYATAIEEQRHSQSERTASLLDLLTVRPSRQSKNTNQKSPVEMPPSSGTNGRFPSHPSYLDRLGIFLTCDYAHVIVSVMEKVSALQLRQSLGKTLAKMKKTGEPILLEKGRRPVAVLISLEDFQKRFVDFEADQRRRELVEKIRAAKLPLPEGKSSLDLIRETRS